MSEADRAKAVREAVIALNLATRKAAESGLRVEYDIVDTREFQMRHPCPFITATVMREA